MPPSRTAPTRLSTLDHSVQAASRGISSDELIEAALARAKPAPSLSWLDVGCGTGTLLRRVIERYEPARVFATDLLPFLPQDLAEHASFAEGPAEKVLCRMPRADRVLLVEVLEHLEAPWIVLREAARKVAPGGRLVATCPNVASLRSRLEMLLRGQLTAFRPGHEPHVTPVLPHVLARILLEEGLRNPTVFYAGRDVIPKTGGRLWPRASQLTAVSVGITADAGS